MTVVSRTGAGSSTQSFGSVSRKAAEAHVVLDRDALRARLSAMSPGLREIADHGVDLGLEHDVHAEAWRERLARELDAVR